MIKNGWARVVESNKELNLNVLSLSVVNYYPKPRGTPPAHRLRGGRGGLDIVFPGRLDRIDADRFLNGTRGGDVLHIFTL